VLESITDFYSFTKFFLFLTIIPIMILQCCSDDKDSIEICFGNVRLWVKKLSSDSLISPLIRKLIEWYADFMNEKPSTS
jgi:hypothetical protein